MASNLDPSEFVDDDFQNAALSAPGAVGRSAAGEPGEAGRAPTREEVESKVTEMQQKLVELKQAQQELERERATLEELRRRQIEFTNGREEMLHHLTRGIGLLEENEFAARREVEQMTKALAEFRDALSKIQVIQEDTWTKDNLAVELTRALTILENARMEWNSARLKFPILAGMAAPDESVSPAASSPLQQALQSRNYAELCKLGLALTWPLALAALAIFLVLLLRP